MSQSRLKALSTRVRVGVPANSYRGGWVDTFRGTVLTQLLANFNQQGSSAGWTYIDYTAGPDKWDISKSVRRQWGINPVFDYGRAMSVLRHKDERVFMGHPFLGLMRRVREVNSELVEEQHTMNPHKRDHPRLKGADATISKLVPGFKYFPSTAALLKPVMRPQDRAILCEKDPEYFHRLAQYVGADHRFKLFNLDVYEEIAASETATHHDLNTHISIPQKLKRGEKLLETYYAAIRAQNDAAAKAPAPTWTDPKSIVPPPKSTDPDLARFQAEAESAIAQGKPIEPAFETFQRTVLAQNNKYANDILKYLGLAPVDVGSASKLPSNGLEGTAEFVEAIPPIAPAAPIPTNDIVREDYRSDEEFQLAQRIAAVQKRIAEQEAEAHLRMQGVNTGALGLSIAELQSLDPEERARRVQAAAAADLTPLSRTRLDTRRTLVVLQAQLDHLLNYGPSNEDLRKSWAELRTRIQVAHNTVHAPLEERALRMEDGEETLEDTRKLEIAEDYALELDSEQLSLIELGKDAQTETLYKSYRAKVMQYEKQHKNKIDELREEIRILKAEQAADLKKMHEQKPFRLDEAMQLADLQALRKRVEAGEATAVAEVQQLQNRFASDYAAKIAPELEESRVPEELPLFLGATPDQVAIMLDDEGQLKLDAAGKVVYPYVVDSALDSSNGDVIKPFGLNEKIKEHPRVVAEREAAKKELQTLKALTQSFLAQKAAGTPVQELEKLAAARALNSKVAAEVAAKQAAEHAQVENKYSESLGAYAQKSLDTWVAKALELSAGPTDALKAATAPFIESLKPLMAQRNALAQAVKQSGSAESKAAQDAKAELVKLEASSEALYTTFADALLSVQESCGGAMNQRVSDGAEALVKADEAMGVAQETLQAIEAEKEQVMDRIEALQDQEELTVAEEEEIEQLRALLSKADRRLLMEDDEGAAFDAAEEAEAREREAAIARGEIDEQAEAEEKAREEAEAAASTEEVAPFTGPLSYNEKDNLRRHNAQETVVGEALGALVAADQAFQQLKVDRAELGLLCADPPARPELYLVPGSAAAPLSKEELRRARMKLRLEFAELNTKRAVLERNIQLDKDQTDPWQLQTAELADVHIIQQREIVAIEERQTRIMLELSDKPQDKKLLRELKEREKPKPSIEFDQLAEDVGLADLKEQATVAQNRLSLLEDQLGPTLLREYAEWEKIELARVAGLQDRATEDYEAQFAQDDVDVLELEDHEDPYADTIPVPKNAFRNDITEEEAAILDPFLLEEQVLAEAARQKREEKKAMEEEFDESEEIDESTKEGKRVARALARVKELENSNVTEEDEEKLDAEHERDHRAYIKDYLKTYKQLDTADITGETQQITDVDETEVDDGWLENYREELLDEEESKMPGEPIDEEAENEVEIDEEDLERSPPTLHQLIKETERAHDIKTLGRDGADVAALTRRAAALKHLNRASRVNRREALEDLQAVRESIAWAAEAAKRAGLDYDMDEDDAKVADDIDAILAADRHQAAALLRRNMRRVAEERDNFDPQAREAEELENGIEDLEDVIEDTVAAKEAEAEPITTAKAGAAAAKISAADALAAGQEVEIDGYTLQLDPPDDPSISDDELEELETALEDEVPLPGEPLAFMEEREEGGIVYEAAMTHAVWEPAKDLGLALHHFYENTPEGRKLFAELERHQNWQAMRQMAIDSGKLTQIDIERLDAAMDEVLADEGEFLVKPPTEAEIAASPLVGGVAAALPASASSSVAPVASSASASVAPALAPRLSSSAVAAVPFKTTRKDLTPAQIAEGQALLAEIHAALGITPAIASRRDALATTSSAPLSVDARKFALVRQALDAANPMPTSTLNTMSPPALAQDRFSALLSSTNAESLAEEALVLSGGGSARKTKQLTDDSVTELATEVGAMARAKAREAKLHKRRMKALVDQRIREGHLDPQSVLDEDRELSAGSVVKQIRVDPTNLMSNEGFDLSGELLVEIPEGEAGFALAHDAIQEAEDAIEAGPDDEDGDDIMFGATPAGPKLLADRMTARRAPGSSAVVDSSARGSVSALAEKPDSLEALAELAELEGPMEVLDFGQSKRGVIQVVDTDSTLTPEELALFDDVIDPSLLSNQNDQPTMEQLQAQQDEILAQLKESDEGDALAALRAHNAEAIEDRIDRHVKKLLADAKKAGLNVTEKNLSMEDVNRSLEQEDEELAAAAAQPFDVQAAFAANAAQRAITNPADYQPTVLDEMAAESRRRYEGHDLVTPLGPHLDPFDVARTRQREGLAPPKVRPPGFNSPESIAARAAAAVESNKPGLSDRERAFLRKKARGGLTQDEVDKETYALEKQYNPWEINTIEAFDLEMGKMLYAKELAKYNVKARREGRPVIPHAVPAPAEPANAWHADTAARAEAMKRAPLAMAQLEQDRAEYLADPQEYLYNRGAALIDGKLVNALDDPAEIHMSIPTLPKEKVPYEIDAQRVPRDFAALYRAKQEAEKFSAAVEMLEDGIRDTIEARAPDNDIDSVDPSFKTSYKVQVEVADELEMWAELRAIAALKRTPEEEAQIEAAFEAMRTAPRLPVVPITDEKAELALIESKYQFDPDAHRASLAKRLSGQATGIEDINGPELRSGGTVSSAQVNGGGPPVGQIGDIEPEMTAYERNLRAEREALKKTMTEREWAAYKKLLPPTFEERALEEAFTPLAAEPVDEVEEEMQMLANLEDTTKLIQSRMMELKPLEFLDGQARVLKHHLQQQTQVLTPEQIAYREKVVAQWRANEEAEDAAVMAAIKKDASAPSVSLAQAEMTVYRRRAQGLDVSMFDSIIETKRQAEVKTAYKAACAIVRANKELRELHEHTLLLAPTPPAANATRAALKQYLADVEQHKMNRAAQRQLLRARRTKKVAPIAFKLLKEWKEARDPEAVRSRKLLLSVEKATLGPLLARAEKLKSDAKGASSSEESAKLSAELAVVESQMAVLQSPSIEDLRSELQGLQKEQRALAAKLPKGAKWLNPARDDWAGRKIAEEEAEIQKSLMKKLEEEAVLAGEIPMLSSADAAAAEEPAAIPGFTPDQVRRVNIEFARQIKATHMFARLKEVGSDPATIHERRAAMESALWEAAKREVRNMPIPGEEPLIKLSDIEADELARVAKQDKAWGVLPAAGQPRNVPSASTHFPVNLASAIAKPLTAHAIVGIDIAEAITEGFGFEGDILSVDDAVVAATTQILEQSVHRFPHATYVITYPIFGRGYQDQLLQAIMKTGVRNIIQATFHIQKGEPFDTAARVYDFEPWGAGVAIIRPPPGFEKVLKDIVNTMQDVMIAYGPSVHTGEEAAAVASRQFPSVDAQANATFFVDQSIHWENGWPNRPDVSWMTAQVEEHIKNLHSFRWEHFVPSFENQRSKRFELLARARSDMESDLWNYSRGYRGDDETANRWLLVNNKAGSKAGLGVRQVEKETPAVPSPSTPAVDATTRALAAADQNKKDAELALQVRLQALQADHERLSRMIASDAPNRAEKLAEVADSLAAARNRLAEQPAKHAAALKAIRGYGEARVRAVDLATKKMSVTRANLQKDVAKLAETWDRLQTRMTSDELRQAMARVHSSIEAIPAQREQLETDHALHKQGLFQAREREVQKVEASGLSKVDYGHGRGNTPLAPQKPSKRLSKKDDTRAIDSVDFGFVQAQQRALRRLADAKLAAERDTKRTQVFNMLSSFQQGKIKQAEQQSTEAAAEAAAIAQAKADGTWKGEDAEMEEAEKERKRRQPALHARMAKDSHFQRLLQKHNQTSHSQMVLPNKK